MEAHEYDIMARVEDRHWWFWAKRRRIQALVRAMDLPAGWRHLDVGCGTGGFLAQVESADARSGATSSPTGSSSSRAGRRYGVDLSERALRWTRGRVGAPLAMGSVNELPYAGGSFHLVTCLDMLCHEAVRERAALAELARVLAPGGWLVLTEPAFDWFRGPHEAASHIARRYRRGPFARSVASAGLDVRRATYSNCLLFPLLMGVRWWNARRARGAAAGAPAGAARTLVGPVPEPLNLVLKAELLLEDFLLKRVGLPFGSSVLCVARKPSGAGDKVPRRSLEASAAAA